jgi:hypothetical protein
MTQARDLADNKLTGDVEIDGTTLTVDSTNNRVGVGTDSPNASAKLDVRGSILNGNSGEAETVIGVADAASNYYVVGDRGNLVLKASSSTPGAQAQSGGRLFLKGGDSYNGQQGDVHIYAGRNLTNNAKSEIVFEQGLDEAMRIDSNGNLLVGSTNTDGFDGTAGLKVANSGPGFLLERTGTRSWLQYIDTNGGWRLYDSTDNIDRMLALANGRILIGKTVEGAGTIGMLLGTVGDYYASVTNSSSNTYHVYNTATPAYTFYVKGNGGIANYSANNTNLSDEREKKNIENLQSTWDCLKEWEIKKFHYNSDDDNIDKRYGVIAQQVQVNCPEVVSDWKVQDAQEEVLWQEGDELPEGVSVGDVKTPAQEEITRLGVKESQMYWMAIKALQEAIAKIETLEEKVAALENA